MEYVVNFFGARFMRRRRLIQLRSPYKRTFTSGGLFIWISSIVIGYEFLDTSRIVRRYGRDSVYSYCLAGLIQIIPMWSYLELTSVITTSGGLYHYVYGVSNELMGFLTGWLLILGITSYLATIADKLAYELDSAIFDNNIEIGLQENLSVDLNYVMENYINSFPQFLRLLVAVAVSGISTPIEKTQIIISVLSYGAIFAIICILIALTADTKLEYFVVPNVKCITVFFSGYYDISNMFTKIYCLAYLGGETRQAEKYMPRVIAFEFITAWIIFTVLPITIVLPVDILHTHSVWIISSILEQTGGYSLYHILDLIAISVQISGMVVYFVTLSRIVVAMASDGLLLPVFSRVETITHYPVKPNLLLGVFAGTMAMIFENDFLERIGKVTENLLAVLPPVCVMLLRYTDAPAYVLKRRREKVSMIEPVENVGLAVWAVVGSTVGISCITSEWAAKYLINENYPSSEHPYRLSIAGVIFIISGSFLIYQKQNVLKTPYRVPLVPFVPVFSIFVQSFMFPVIPLNCVMAIGTWTLLGLVLYLVYGMQYSHEHLEL